MHEYAEKGGVCEAMLEEEGYVLSGFVRAAGYVQEV
jgi:hypothetical protein